MEMATKRKPNLSKLLEWGRPIWLKVKNAGALEIHAISVNFVGYDVEVKGFRVYWPALEPESTSIEGEWEDDDILTIPEAPSMPQTPPKGDTTTGNNQKEGLTDTFEPPILAITVS
ncbi:hypothetical protein B0H10DRAFT_2242085 [Mycena sp. CBHHK59/15]|nr:hypothetical protein B0H10DRAFT_2242085 [Mycena sp. CBHHK59/15]